MFNNFQDVEDSLKIYIPRNHKWIKKCDILIAKKKIRHFTKNDQVFTKLAYKIWELEIHSNY